VSLRVRIEVENCPDNPDCILRDTNKGCYRNIHHLQYPKSLYRTELEQRFRRSFTRVICAAEHIRIHQEQPTPPKPSVEQMLRILDRQDRINNALDVE
jgi:hypothetical protein